MAKEVLNTTLHMLGGEEGNLRILATKEDGKLRLTLTWGAVTETVTLTQPSVEKQLAALGLPSAQPMANHEQAEPGNG